MLELPMTDQKEIETAFAGLPSGVTAMTALATTGAEPLIYHRRAFRKIVTEAAA